MLPVVWLTVQVTGALLLTVLWTIAGTTLDPRQAKRLFPLCTGAAIAGAFVGTLLAGPMAAIVGVSNLLVVGGLLLAAASALAAAALGQVPATAPRRAARSFSQDLLAGYRDVRVSPLMRLVAVAYVLFAVLLFSVSFPFMSAVEASTSTELERTTMLGLLSAAVTATAFVVALGLANRVYARIGVAAAAMLLPMVYLVGFGTWLVSFGIVTALGFRFAQQVTQRGLSNAAWSAMFNVVPVERRPQVLAFMDGVPGQLGTCLSGVLLLVVRAWFAPQDVFLLGIAAALVCVVVVRNIRRRYGAALLGALRAGLGEQVLSAGPGLVALDHDPQVRAELQEAARGPSPAARRLAVELLGRTGGPDVTTSLMTALEDDDPGVRASGLRALAATDGAWSPDGPPGVADGRLRTDPDPVVRAALAVGLASHGQPAEAGELMAALVAGPGEAERVAGLRCGRRGWHPRRDTADPGRTNGCLGRGPGSSPRGLGRRRGPRDGAATPPGRAGR